MPASFNLPFVGWTLLYFPWWYWVVPTLCGCYIGCSGN